MIHPITGRLLKRLSLPTKKAVFYFVSKNSVEYFVKDGGEPIHVLTCNLADISKKKTQNLIIKSVQKLVKRGD